MARKSSKILTPEEVRREAWYQGDLRHLTMEGPQRDLYDAIQQTRIRGVGIPTPYVLNLHRRLGKTFLSLLLAVEECLKRPRRYAKFLAPTGKQAIDILEEHWPTIMEECPVDLFPDEKKREMVFLFWNPRWEREYEIDPKKKHLYCSRLKLYGVDKDRGGRIRGTSTDFAISDECREVQGLRSVIDHSLLPTFKGREDTLLILISTPPESMDHEFVSWYIDKAQKSGHYYCVPASEDPNWDDETDESFAEKFGGRDSPGYLREIECRLISDRSNLIIPEYIKGDADADPDKNVFLHTKTTRPSHYVAYECADFGRGVDPTGIVFAYVDFRRQMLVVEDELLFREEDTATIAKMWRDHSIKVFPNLVEESEGRKIVAIERVMEADPRTMIDIETHANLRIRLWSSKTREAHRNAARAWFSTGDFGRISINRRCEQLIYQLRNGQIVRDGQFSRSPSLGHCDLVSALIILCDVADLTLNPFPIEKRRSSEDVVYIREDPPLGPGQRNRPEAARRADRKFEEFFGRPPIRRF